MRRILAFATGATAGAALAYLFDPDRGRSRRARLSDQAAARARDLSRSAKGAVEYQKGVARGVIHDLAEPMRRPKEQYDDETLLQKVRSEALGYWRGTTRVEVDVEAGTVTIEGAVADESEHADLLDLIRGVDGVAGIDDQLRVG